MDAALASQLVELVDSLENEVNQLGFWFMWIAIALTVIACRVGKSDGQRVQEQQKETKRAGNTATLLSRGCGKVFELTFEYGTPSFNGFATDHVRVVDCDDNWVLVESINPKKPGQAVIRISQIESVKEIAE